MQSLSDDQLYKFIVTAKFIVTLKLLGIYKKELYLQNMGQLYYPASNYLIERIKI